MPELWQAAAGYLAAVNLAAFALMGLDKRRAGRLAHLGKGAVSSGRAGGRAGRAAGHAGVSPQDEALVFPVRDAGAADCAGDFGGVACRPDFGAVRLSEKSARFS